MKASVITALSLAAYTMAGPIGLDARGLNDCTCEIETVTITIPAPTETVPIGGATTTSCTDTETDTVTSTATETDAETTTNTVTEAAPPANTGTGTGTAPPTNTNTETAPPANTGTGTAPPTNTNTETAPPANTGTETAPPANTGTGTGTAPPTNTNTETAPPANTGTGTAPPTNTNTETAPPTNTGTPPGCEGERCHGTGHIIQDLGPQVNRLLTVTGEDGESFLVQVDEDVYNLLEGKVSLSDSVGNIIGDAASIGDLVADLGPIVDCILTIVGEDTHILLVQLAPEVADLLQGTTATLGLDSLSNPVGQIVHSLGLNLKRDIQHNFANVAGLHGENIIVDLTGEVGAIIHDLHLSSIVGAVIDVAIDVTQLLQRLGAPTEHLIVVIGQNGGALLIELAPEVASIVQHVLPKVGTPLGNVIAVVGHNL